MMTRKTAEGNRLVAHIVRHLTVPLHRMTYKAAISAASIRHTILQFSLPIAHPFVRPIQNQGILGSSLLPRKEGCQHNARKQHGQAKDDDQSAGIIGRAAAIDHFREAETFPCRDFAFLRLL